MVYSIIGGACIAAACLVIALLRGGASRTPKPIWAKGEWSESTLAIGIVSLLALGVSMVINAAQSGLTAVLIGLAVGVVGSILAVIIGVRRAARMRSRSA